MRLVQRLVVLAVSVLSFTFATSFLVDGGAQAALHTKTLIAHTGSLASCEFGINQVFDTQWGVTGSPSQTLSASSFRLPYNSTSRLELTSSQLASTDYFQFVFNSAASDWELVLFDSSGTQLQVVDQTGTFLYEGPGFLFYNGGNFYGTLITTQGSYALGGAGSFSVTMANPSNAQVSTFNSCQTSIIPLAVPPSAPQSPRATSASGQATVTWGASVTPGSSAITSYTVTAVNDSTKTCSVSATSGPFGCTVTGLTNGQVYTFEVTATNSQLQSVASVTSNAVIPATSPGAPTGLTATAAKGQVKLSWTAPTFTGSNEIIGYTVNESGGDTQSIDTGAQTTLTLTGLSAGKTYSFSVTATNDQGLSGVASASVNVVAIGAPSPPLDVIATGANGQVKLSWAPPTQLGSTSITDYTVTESGEGNATFDAGTATSFNVTGLQAGDTYSFSVVATNDQGLTSQASASVSAVPYGPPTAPLDITAIAGVGEVKLSWSPPTQTGSNAITNYVVTQSGEKDATFNAGSDTSLTVTGLRAGASYSFSVTATNDQGLSGASSGAVSTTVLAAVPPVTTTTTPSSPTTTTLPTTTPTTSPSSSTTTPTTSPSTTTTIASSAPSSTTAPTGPSPNFLSSSGGNQITLHLDLTTGQLVAGSLVTVTATGLEANSLLVITVHSTPMTLLTTHVGPDGSYTGSVALPSGLEDGMHEVMASGVAGGVTSQVLGGFVESKGVATSVVQPGPVTTPIVPNDPRLVQALRYHRSAYNIAADPSSGSAVLVTGTAILAIAGAGGIAGERRRQQKKASVSSAVTKKLKGLKIEGARLGDRSLTWRFPFTSWTDKIGQVWPGVVGRYSAVAPRVLLDGTWARAMFGSGALLLWLAGIVTALVACTAHGSSGLAPAFPLLVAMVVLGIFDAAAGAAAWLTIAVVTLVTGGFETWSDLRTLLGLGVLFATISLLAHVIRPLRRNLESGADERAERFFDFVMMPPFVAFASGSMLKALNGLSGLTLVTPVEISHFRWIVYGVILARLALEDVVHRLYPERAQTVQPDKLVSPTRRWTSVALVTRAAIYILVGVPFFGLSATLFIAAILLSVPAILKIFEDNLPNSVKLNKWLPRGLLMFFCSMVIGIVLAWDLEGSHPTPAVVRSTFLLLLIPGIIAGMLELFGREGGAWKKGKHQWLLGGAVWLSALGIVTGHLLLFPTIHVA